MQAEGHTRLDGCRKPLKLKFQIQQELGVKPEFTKGAKGSNYAPELSEWLVSTLLSVVRAGVLTVSSKGQTVCW